MGVNWGEKGEGHGGWKEDLTVKLIKERKLTRKEHQ